MKTFAFCLLFFSISLNAQISYDDGTNPFPSGFNGGFDSSIATADTNNDGIVDKVCVVGFDGSDVFGKEYENNGSGVLTHDPSSALPVDPNAASDSAYADFDADGDLDYVDFGANISNQPRLKLIEKISSGYNDKSSNSGLLPVADALIIVAYIDEDNLPDIFINGQEASSGLFAGWYHNNGDFTFTLVQTFTGLSGASGDIGDVDGDIDDDIIYTGNKANGLLQMFFLEKNGTTDFSTTELTAPDFLAHTKGSIAFGYNDGDDIVDYFASGGLTPSGSIFQFKKNNGTGQFSDLDIPLDNDGNPLEVLDNPSYLFFDANNNGKADFLAAGNSTEGSEATLFENTDTINFVFADEFDGFTDGTVVAKRFNSDPFMDILYLGDSSGGGNPIARLYLNTTGIDTENPNAVCQNITVQLDANGNASINGIDVDGGSTDNVGITSYSVNPNSFNCNDLGSNTVTLTVSDAAGNTDTCTATVTVDDDINPTTIGQNITIDLSGNPSVTITPANLDNGSFDNCNFTQTISQNTFTTIGVYNVDLTSTDTSSNSDTETYQVEVVNILGVDDFRQESFVMAPNPVLDILHFQVPESVFIESISVIDLLGKVVLQQEGGTSINVSQLSNGVYIVKAVTNKGSVSKKITKQ